MDAFNTQSPLNSEWTESIEFFKKLQIPPVLIDQIMNFCYKFEDSQSVVEKERTIYDAQSEEQSVRLLIMSLARFMGVEINDIKIFADSKVGYAGMYINDDKTFVLNLSPDMMMFEGRVSALVTIMHELRHAQQFQIISKSAAFPHLSATIKSHIDNYVHPKGKVIQNAKYFSNFAEIDAEHFSYEMLTSMFERITKTSQKYGTLALTAGIKLNPLKSKFSSNLNAALSVINLNERAIKTVIDSLTGYASLLFSDNPPPREQLDLMVDNMIYGNDTMLFSKEAEELVDFQLQNLYGIQKAVFEGVDIRKIARNLDDPLIKYIEKIEDKLGDYGLVGFEKYSRHIRVLVAKGASFLRAHGIEFNADDGGEIIDKVIENMPAIVLQNFVEYGASEQKERDHSLLSSMDIYATSKDDKLADRCVAFIEANVPKKEIIAMLEKLSDEPPKGSYYYDLTRKLLDGYAYVYDSEKTFHTCENFVVSQGVRTKFKNFSELYEKYQSVMAKFLVDSLLSQKLSKQDIEQLKKYEIGVYKPVSLEVLKKEIEKRVFSKGKLQKILTEQNEENLALKALKKGRDDFDELLELFSARKKILN